MANVTVMGSRIQSVITVRGKVAILITALVLSACATEQADVRGLRAIADSFVAAGVAGDYTTIAQLANDSVAVAFALEVSGKEPALLEAAAGGLDVRHAIIRGDSALVEFEFAYPGGRKLRWTENEILGLFFVRVQGKWRIDSSITLPGRI